ncbi:MAG: glutaredoxin family protein [Gammaproteobacteria bacterium]|nr:glutaredoxin family protein [Gammaproteobacteria bacterium]
MLKFFSNWMMFVALLLMIQSVNAEIYKWVDAKGRMHFSDQPPMTNKAETIELPEITTYTQARLSGETVDLDDEAMNQGSSINEKNKKVVMYSAAWCGVCTKAKKYFRKNKIAYKEYDIDTSKKGKRDYKKLKARGVPVILVGKKRLNGFNAQQFEALYKKAG